ncbi:unnamed protein product [Camellia sinensis]
MEGMVCCYDTMDVERWCDNGGRGKGGLDDNGETERAGFLNYKYFQKTTVFKIQRHQLPLSLYICRCVCVCICLIFC